MIGSFPYTMRRLEAEVDVADFIEAGGVDVPKFEALCRQCPNFGRAWSCPPHSYDPMSIWNAHDRMRIMARIYERDEAASEVSLDEAGKFLAVQKQDFLGELLVLERETVGSFALAQGSCGLCRECARGSGEPCRHHEKMRPSVEAIGGDVGMMASKYLDTEIMWGRDNIAPPRLMLVGALLV